MWSSVYKNKVAGSSYIQRVKPVHHLNKLTASARVTSHNPYSSHWEHCDPVQPTILPVHGFLLDYEPFEF